MATGSAGKYDWYRDGALDRFYDQTRVAMYLMMAECVRLHKAAAETQQQHDAMMARVGYLEQELSRVRDVLSCAQGELLCVREELLCARQELTCARDDLTCAQDARQSDSLYRGYHVDPSRDIDLELHDFERHFLNPSYDQRARANAACPVAAAEDVLLHPEVAFDVSEYLVLPS